MDGLYYPGYRAALAKVKRMERRQLLALCEDLYGLDNCDRNLDDDRELLTEALFQLELEWMIPPPYRSFYPDAE